MFNLCRLAWFDKTCARISASPGSTDIPSNAQNKAEPMNNLDTLYAAISAITDAPAFADRAASFPTIARISLLIALGGFLMIWRLVERDLAAAIAATGDVRWSFWQSLRVMGLIVLSATLLDASLLSAALGDPTSVSIQQVIRGMAETGWPTEGLAPVGSDAKIAAITQAVQAHARSSLLHAGACFAAALFVISCIARKATPNFAADRSGWFTLALILGLFSWPTLSNGAAWSALSGDIEPYLRVLLAS
jgi:hypothetical protein